MSNANETQVGGSHYKTDGEQHWDRMWRLYGRGYFVGCITKYVERYHKKNGIEDLKKSRHFLDKLIELEEAAKAKADQEKQARAMQNVANNPGLGGLNDFANQVVGRPKNF